MERREEGEERRETTGRSGDTSGDTSPHFPDAATDLRGKDVR